MSHKEYGVGAEAKKKGYGAKACWGESLCMVNRARDKGYGPAIRIGTPRAGMH